MENNKINFWFYTFMKAILLSLVVTTLHVWLWMKIGYIKPLDYVLNNNIWHAKDVYVALQQGKTLKEIRGF